MESTEFHRAAIAATLMLLLAPAANAALYCCLDAAGKKVCGDTMPSVCIGRSTTLKSEGKPAKQIEPPPTPEQRAQREAEEKRKKEEEAALVEQRRQDQALLNTYVSEKDVDAQRERAEQDVHTQIKNAEAKIAAAQTRRKKYEAEAEFYKNKPLPEEVRRGLKDAEFEITAQSELIENKKKDLEAIRVKFDADKKRYQEIVKARAAPR